MSQPQIAEILGTFIGFGSASKTDKSLSFFEETKTEKGKVIAAFTPPLYNVT